MNLMKVLFVSLIFSAVGCAHVEPSRDIAEVSPAKMTYSASAHGPVYKLKIETQYPLNSERTFADIVDGYRGTAVMDSVGQLLNDRKPKPMNKLRMILSSAPAPSPYALSYTIVAYPKGWKILSEATRVLCTDEYSAAQGRGSWRQRCVPDLKYKSTRKYISAYVFESQCDERGQYAVCSFEGGGTVEPIKVPGGKIVKALFGASDFTAAEVACMTIETIVHTYSAMDVLFKQSGPFAPKTEAAVNDYHSSPKYAEVSNLCALR